MKLVYQLVLKVFFNEHRPHQARDQTPPDADIAEAIPIEGGIRRRQVPATTIHE